MKSRNVIICLIAVVVLLGFIFIKIRNEPRKRLIFNRNPSRIEYSSFALCRMECYSVNANSVTSIFRNGNVVDRKRKKACTVFKVNSQAKLLSIFIVVQQCGNVAKVIDCYVANREAPCICADTENPPISFLKSTD